MRPRFFGELRTDIVGRPDHVLADRSHQCAQLPLWLRHRQSLSRRCGGRIGGRRFCEGAVRTGQLSHGLRQRRRHHRLGDPGRAASETFHETVRRLSVVGIARTKPALEIVSVIADERVADHGRDWTGRMGHQPARRARP